jgi:hypothetical protein
MKNSAIGKHTSRAANTRNKRERVEQVTGLYMSAYRISCIKGASHAAPIAKLLHLFSLLGDLKCFDEPASPDSAIFIRALALNTSTTIYSKCVNIGHDE